MKKLLTIFAVATISTTAIADALLFSQYDGVNTWNNVYFEVDNAKDFVKPGVGFTNAHAGSQGAAVEAVTGVNRSVTTSYNLGVNAYIVSYVFSPELNGKALNTQTRNGVAIPVTKSELTEAEMEADIGNIPGYATVTRTNVDAVAEVEEAQASYEQSLPPCAIVVVPVGVDMEAFIEDFMESV